ncbi:MAG: cation:dicarboxylase symporter family transporter [Parasporobacterium sp.]|nr:cation:dicarboxylase symporter family transporter [Parasporobacterium sp.]
MRSKNEQRTFLLNGTGIDECSEFLMRILETNHVERQNRIRIRLSMEELLLRYRDRFGEGKKFRVLFYHRINSPNLQIELEGDIYNPLNTQETELEDWNESMLSSLGIIPQYYYTQNRNILRLTLPSQRMNPVLRVVFAIAIAVAAGVLLRLLLPTEEGYVYLNGIFTPIYDLWNRILNLISGPVIFLMVITTVLGMGRLSGKGTSGRWVIARYFLITAGIAAFTVAISSLISRVTVFPQQMDLDTVSEVMEEFFQIVPSNLITPFVDADTPQLILLAFILGGMLNLIRDRVPNLVKFFKQLNSVGMLAADWSSWLVPIFTCILLSLRIGTGQIGLLVGLWKPLALALVLLALVLAAAIIFTALTKHVSVGVLLRKMGKPFLTTLKNGSLNASYGQTEISCVRKMGMNRDFTEVSLSHGLVLYMPASILGALVFTVQAAALYRVRVTWLWYVMAVLLVAVLMEAAPPVPGVSLLVYIVVFYMLGIPDDVLIPAMVFDIIFGIFATASNQMMLQIEMIHQADKVGLINRSILRKMDV